MSEEIDRLDDRTIDDVARQMTEGQPSGDFRARIIARIAEGGGARRTRRAGWILTPIAAAAAIVVAVFLSRGSRERAPVTAQPQSAAVVHVERPKEPPRIDPEPPRGGLGVAAKRRPQQVVTPRAIDPSGVEALAPLPIVAPSIAIRTLTTEPLALEELEPPTPIAIAPLATPEGERP